MRLNNIYTIKKQFMSSLFDLTEADNLKEFKNKTKELTMKDLERINLAGGQTILNYAVSNASLNIIKYLLDLGFDVNLKSKNDGNALYRAIYCEEIDIVKLLLKYNPD